MLDMNNAAVLGSTGRVFCLVASPAEIAQRLEGDQPERPLLAGSDRRQRIEELLAEREDGYARFEQVETDGRTPAEIVEDLLERLGVGSG
jgi:shikimate kinase